MTSNVLDRKREIGMLRSMGARRRDVPAMFHAEGLVIGVLGWLIGIPVGDSLARFILWVFERRFEAALDVTFPLWPIGVALLVTVVMSVLVLRPPMRRILQMPPGAALLYE